jgi:hypothetical protein
MMVIVALAGVACLGAREFWAWWLRRNHTNPVSPSQLSAKAAVGRGNRVRWVAGQPIPVQITYDFKFGNRKLPPGSSCLLWADVWFEDLEAGLAVESYTFDAPLSVGGRESASGSLTWNALLPHPGRYMLHRDLYYKKAWGELQLGVGGGSTYEVVADAPSSQSPNHQRAQP